MGEIDKKRERGAGRDELMEAEKGRDRMREKEKKEGDTSSTSLPSI